METATDVGTDPGASAGGPAPDAGDAPVRLERIGTVPVVGNDGEPIVVFGEGLPEAAARRLQEVGFRVETAADALDQVGLALVSTRMDRDAFTRVMSAVRAKCRAPVVALVHTGGEGLAVEIMRGGGAGVVAEGNEEALGALLAGNAHDTSLLDTFDRQVGKSRGLLDPLRGRDPITHLPGESAFEHRLADLAQAGDVPRVAFLRIAATGEPGQHLSDDASALLRRRLSSQFRQITKSYGVELFSLGGADYFGVIGESLSPNRAEQLGLLLARVAETFAPLANRPLTLAMGHAGSEVTAEPGPLRELAMRALEVAAMEKQSTVIGAESLALGVSSTTELESAQRMVAYVERHDPYPGGHGARVSEYASELAWGMGYEGSARTRIALAALLHDVGKVSLPPGAIAGPDGLEGELLEAYRTHPVVGAAYLRVSGGNEVAAAVRSHHERWDGAGFPDGLAGDEIPIAARIIAVADAFDRLRTRGQDGWPQSLAETLEQLSALQGSALDPELVETAVPLFARMATEASG